MPLRPAARRLVPAALPAMVLAALAAAPLRAPASLAADAPADPLVETRWKSFWKEIANNYAAVGDEYFAVPDWRREYPSSARVDDKRMTEKQYAESSRLEQKYHNEQDREVTRKLTKSKEEVAAAVLMLPEAEAGAYGRILSGNVRSIVDGDEMMLDDVWLVDKDALDKAKAERLHQFTSDESEKFKKNLETAFPGPANAGRRWGIALAYLEVAKKAGEWEFADRDAALKRQAEGGFRRRPWQVIGFKTDKLKENTRWPAGGVGVALAVVKVEADRVIAVPAARLEAGLTEDKVLAALAQRGVDKAAFVNLMLEAKRREPRNFLPLVLAALENGGKLPGPAKPAPAAPKPAAGGSDIELAP